MANELMEKKESAVAVIEGHELGDMIKPLIREIHLFDSYVAGTSHLEDASVLEEIRVGDLLDLRREISKFDSNAVMLLFQGSRKLGYVPEKDNLIFARLMDAGKLLKARITKIEKKGSLRQIRVGIYLVDF